MRAFVSTYEREKRIEREREREKERKILRDMGKDSTSKNSIRQFVSYPQQKLNFTLISLILIVVSPLLFPITLKFS